MQLLMSSSMADCGGLPKPLIEIKQKTGQNIKYLFENNVETHVCVGGRWGGCVYTFHKWSLGFFQPPVNLNGSHTS